MIQFDTDFFKFNNNLNLTFLILAENWLLQTPNLFSSVQN